MLNSTKKPKIAFKDRELQCEMRFREMGDCWHIYTPENYTVVFGTEKDYKVGMNLVAICSKAFPDVKVLTFEIMSNHLHLTVAGLKERVEAFLRMLIDYLERYLKGTSRPVDLSGWANPPRKIIDLDDLRNVIAYNNRNGYLVDPDSTPFTYPWGANRFFFNQELRQYHCISDESLSQKYLRETFHTRMLDSFCGLNTINGYVSPVLYCDITTAEAVFRNARHYFYKVARDVESQKTIAAELGEKVFYTDMELYAFINSKCKSEFNVDSPSLLPRDAKIQLAKTLHYDYNADNDKIARILRLDASVLNSLFPL
jgi:REP element-mobilizing transposase RayT